jgi:ABC-type lipoprotein export system ATPase subunit
MMTLIADLVHERGVAAIVSTHDPRMAAHADRIIDLRDGRIIAAAPRSRREARAPRSSTDGHSGDTVDMSRT